MSEPRPIPDLQEEIGRRYIQLHFGALHQNLQREYRLHRRYYRANIGSHLPQDRAAQIADLGCGLGHFVHFLIQEGYTDVTGVDRSPDAVEACTRAGLPVVCADLFAWLPGRQFDLIVATDLLEHLTREDLNRFLPIVRDALKPGGRLIIKVPNAANPITGAASIYLDYTHQRAFTDLSLRSILSIYFPRTDIFGQRIFIFHENPLSWIGYLGQAVCDRLFFLLALLYGQRETRIFKKSIFAIAQRA